MKRIWVFGLVLLVGQPALAVTPEESALAEELFRTAKEKMAVGDFRQACPMLAESQRIDPGGGTLLTLAICHESAGKTAAAWVEFREALSWAKREGRMNREAVAAEHLRNVEARLARIKLELPEGVRRVEGLTITLDGIALREASWDVATPVDLGEHVLTVQAPGHETRRYALTVEQEGTTTPLPIEELSPLTAPAPPTIAKAPIPPAENTVVQASRAPVKPPTPAGNRWILPVVGGVTGLLVAGVGAGMTTSAASLWSDAKARCPDTLCSDPVALEASRDAGARADIATGLFIGAGAILAASVILYIATPTRSPSALRGSFSF